MGATPSVAVCLILLGNRNVPLDFIMTKEYRDDDADDTLVSKTATPPSHNATACSKRTTRGSLLMMGVRVRVRVCVCVWGGAFVGTRTERDHTDRRCEGR
jgi:hypothetical protein